MKRKENKTEDEGAQFSSKIRLVCSCLGCVVGTGNIWRFPRIVANNSGEAGGLVFLLVWFVFLLVWSVPLLLIEYGTGRFTKKAVVGSFRAFLGDKFAWCGAWVTFVTFMISCYYAVVLGWCFYYVIHCIVYDLPTTDIESQKIFDEFARNSSWPVLTQFLAVAVAGLSVVKGVKTIERVNLFLVPLLLLIILFTFTWSLTRPYADYGIKYLFTPNWTSLGDPRLWVDALSQSAFVTGAGSGLVVPYSSFMSRDHGIVRYATVIPATNNVISLIAVIMIFSTVSSTLITKDRLINRAHIVATLKDPGPGSTGLTFIWIPVLFSTTGIIGRILCVLVFLCLAMAGITSLVANMELMTRTLFDFGLPRKYSTLVTVLLTFLIGLPSALSLEILTNQDFVWGFALVVNGLMFLTMVIVFGAEKFRRDVINDFSTDDWTLPRFWKWIVKFLAPLEAVAVIVWWAVDLMFNEKTAGDRWYEFGTETFMMTMTQWLSAMLLLIVVNAVVVRVTRQLSAQRTLLT